MGTGTRVASRAAKSTVVSKTRLASDRRGAEVELRKVWTCFLGRQGGAAVPAQKAHNRTPWIIRRSEGLGCRDRQGMSLLKNLGLVLGWRQLFRPSGGFRQVMHPSGRFERT
jgi:hypothetical protein